MSDTNRLSFEIRQFDCVGSRFHKHWYASVADAIELYLRQDLTVREYALDYDIYGFVANIGYWRTFEQAAKAVEMYQTKKRNETT